MAAPRYGEWSCTSCLADRAITTTSGCLRPVAAFRNSGVISAPLTLSSRARSIPRKRQVRTATAAAA